MIFFVGSSILLLMLTACGAGTPATPTESPDAIYTQVASTIQAAVTETAAAMPTNTSTPESTPTEIPTPTLPPLPTVDTTTGANATAVPFPTTQPVVPTTAGSQTGDHAILGYQSPADRGVYSLSEEVKVTWGFLNTGTTTWTKKCYTFRQFGGTSIQDHNILPMPDDIKPNQKVEFNIAAFLPSKPGDYISRWALFNCSKAPFYEVYFAFTVK
jgi:Ig-like domain from next to BRCA1 gene